MKKENLIIYGSIGLIVIIVITFLIFSSSGKIESKNESPQNELNFLDQDARNKTAVNPQPPKQQLKNVGPQKKEPTPTPESTPTPDPTPSPTPSPTPEPTNTPTPTPEVTPTPSPSPSPEASPSPN